jgi:hypothetical protein
MDAKIVSPKIVWQKWQDPFSDESVYSSPEDFVKSPDFIDDISEDDHYPNDHSDEPENSFAKKHIKAIITPFGLMPYNDQYNIGSSFNFWIGHTNFDLTPKIAAIIENNEGVEVLDVYTRYRFRIGIGQLFNSSDTLSNINQTIYSYLSGLLL